MVGIAELIDGTISHLRALKAQPRNEIAAVRELTAKLRRTLDAVAEQTIRELAALGRMPTDEMSMRRILRAFEERTEALAEDIVDDAVAAAQRGRNKATHGAQQAGRGVSFTEVPTPLMERMRAAAFEASQSTMRRLVGDVRAVLADAMQQGLGIDDAASNLRTAFEGMRNHELVRVARTEIQGFQNLGAYETERELGIQYHRWITAGDERVRETHIDVEDEIVAVGTRFSNGLLHPLDRSGPIEEWVNCRCRAIPFIPPRGRAAPHEGPFYEDELVEMVAS